MICPLKLSHPKAYAKLRRLLTEEQITEAFTEETLEIAAPKNTPHICYVWRHGSYSNGIRYKQCGCGAVRPTRASQDELELASREHCDVTEPP